MTSERGRDLSDLLDPYTDTAGIYSGQRMVVAPDKALANIRLALERIDLDPSVDWAIEDFVSADVAAVLFDRLGVGAVVLVDALDFIHDLLLARFGDLCRRRIAATYDVNAAVGTHLVYSPASQLLAIEMLNARLADRDRVHIDENWPRLRETDSATLLETWTVLVVMFWHLTVELRRIAL